MNSRDNKQLTGQVGPVSKKCNDTATGEIGKMFEGNKTFSTFANNALSEQSAASPCGQLAKMHFNDNFELYTEKGHQIEITDSNISDIYDKTYVFKNSENSEITQWLSVEDSTSNLFMIFFFH